MKKRILILAGVVLLLAFCVNFQGIPYTVDINTTALRFYADGTGMSEIAVSLKGGIVRRLIGNDTFEGSITIGRRPDETGTRRLDISLNLNDRTPVIREYIGSELHAYGIFLIIDGNFDKAAVKLTDDPVEYVVWGMTVEEFLAQEMR